jgi:hypothetical protein
MDPLVKTGGIIALSRSTKTGSRTNFKMRQLRPTHFALPEISSGPIKAQLARGRLEAYSESTGKPPAANRVPTAKSERLARKQICKLEVKLYRMKVRGRTSTSYFQAVESRLRNIRKSIS